MDYQTFVQALDKDAAGRHFSVLRAIASPGPKHDQFRKLILDAAAYGHSTSSAVSARVHLGNPGSVRVLQNELRVCFTEDDTSESFAHVKNMNSWLATIGSLMGPQRFYSNLMYANANAWADIPPVGFRTLGSYPGKFLIYCRTPRYCNLLLEPVSGKLTEWLLKLSNICRRTIVRLDFSGFGTSSATEGAPESFSMNTFVASVIAVADELGIGQIDLVAEYFATDIALLLAANHPGRVSSMVLWESDALTTKPYPGTSFNWKLIDGIRQEMSFETWIRHVWTPSLGVVSDDASSVAVYQDCILSNHPDAESWEKLQKYIADSQDALDAYEKVKSPVLSLASDVAEREFAATDARIVAELLGQQFQLIQGGHRVLEFGSSVQQTQFANAVRRFITTNH